jgi:tRNA(Ile)-lysidine synthase
LRGDESDADEQFVTDICEALHRPLFVEKFVTASFAQEHKLSIQVVARKLRYDWFETIMQNNDYDYVLTAHHLDDSLETFLINITRGTGLDGITGIPEQNNKIIRPLLLFSRHEIESFAQANKLPWREDSSNASDKYLRNRMRHHVVPVLKELNPSLLTSFEATLAHLQQAQSMVVDASNFVYEKVVATFEDQIKIDLTVLQTYPNYKAYLYQWLFPFGFTDWEVIYELPLAQTGKKVFSESHVILKDRAHLIVYPRRKLPKEIYWIQAEDKDVKIPLKLSFCPVDDITDPSRNTIFVDESLLQYPLQIRKWQKGDVFYPLGLRGKKKVSKYFKDEKMSLLDKSSTWLLCSDNQIVWVIGKRADDRFKVIKQTTKIIQIQLQE